MNEGCQCGMDNISPRIINGHPVKKGKYPSYVYFEGMVGCGGGLITDRHVMTNAHCIVGHDSTETKRMRNNLKLVLGPHSRNDFLNFPGLEIQEFIPHEKYVRGVGKYFYDIAIIKLKKRIEFKNGLNPICLPNFEDTDNMFAYGLGKQDKNGQLVNAKVMHEVDLDRISDDRCEQLLSTEEFKVEYHKELTMCSLNEFRRNNVCLGDSGSPVSTRKDGRVYGVGLPSTVEENCTLPDYRVFPTTYEKVYAHLEWIRDKTKDGYYCFGEHHPFSPGFHPEYQDKIDFGSKFVNEMDNLWFS